MRKLIIFGLIGATIVAGAPKKKIVVAGRQDAIAQFAAVSPDVEIVAAPPSGDALLRAVADADAFIGMPSRDVIVAGKRLAWVQVLEAGVEKYRFPELINSSIVLTNLKKVASPGIADHAMGMLLALTRQLNYFIAARTQESWVRKRYNVFELQGMTAVVIGVGGIGSQVAQRAWASGMHVIGVDPQDINPTPYVERLVYPDRLDTVLPLADVVFVCAPLTTESEHMIGEKQFGLMKRGVFFIAVSRGKLYATPALVSALESGKVAGAGLDVTDPEPLPKGHPLWKFENVIVTPHIATYSQHEGERAIAVIEDNIARFAKGEPLRNVVDKQKGY
jgi:phosphoglycerate dehydrogenase-like enzyme